MAKRMVSRRQDIGIKRIHSLFPRYAKRMAMFVGVGAVAAFTYMYFTQVDTQHTGRFLLAVKEHCVGDAVLPIIPHEETWNVVIRTLLYLVALGYLFLGVAISADTFMASIEVITSKTKTEVIAGVDVEVEIWNSTVANLTLMALGSSAPEILLAVIETVSLTFEAGDLGPGTIVGSAAFNLLFITSICISCLPETEEDSTQLESREIEEFGVYVITAVASLWAYLWMVIALAWSSKDEVMMWEALATLLMFPLLVVVSWAQDQGWWGWFGAGKVAPEEDSKTGPVLKSVTGDGGKRTTRRASHVRLTKTESQDIAAMEIGGDDSASVDPQEAAKRAAQEAMKKKKKSRLEYRIQATRKMTGGKRVLPTEQKGEKKVAELEPVEEDTGPPKVMLNFDAAEHKCDESCGTMKVKVIRSGILDKPCTVQFDTSDGDATCKDNEDYVSAAGTLEFAKDETEKHIEITIIDDNEWAPDKHFYVRLYNAKITDDSQATVVIGTATTQITILNDDDPGSISFEAKTFHAMDTKQTVEIPLIRKDGYDGNVLAFISTRDGTATANKDYVPLSDDFEVHFDDKVREANVAIDLLHNQENANSTFTVEITHVEPEGAKLGDFSVCTVIITNDKNYQKLMEEVVAMMDSEMDKYGVGTSSWAEQFHDAMNMGGDDEGSPEFSDYLMHFLSFYWKVIHAFVPPTDYGGGWYTFVVSLVFIGVITMFVGDTAKMLGCCIGLPDAITAITFVALGTSLPDTFASVEATTSDETADAAITNVTGSNSVNVFLGLGLPWVMACFYHAANGTTFIYASGDLVFSVLVYFVFAFICIAVLYIRRKKFGGELGGNKTVAYMSSAALGTSWLLYIILSALATEGHIDASVFSR